MAAAVATASVSYRIDRETGRIRTVCAGPVHLGDVVEHFRTLAGDPELPPRLDVLLDLLAMTSLPDGDQIRAAAAEASRLRAHVAWGALAVVAGSEALFGMSRVFEALVEPYFERTGVFRDCGSAEAWLDAPPSPGDGRAR
jgi:hypothetical protein